MNFPKLAILFAAVLAGSTAQVFSQAAVDPAEGADDLPQPIVRENLPDSLKPLTDDQIRTLQGHLVEANAFIRDDRVSEALEAIHKAKKIAPNYYGAYNLAGAAWTRLRAFGNARQEFLHAQRFSGTATYDVAFNIAEMDFVDRRYPEALAGFQSLLDSFPRLPDNAFYLIRFKLILCHIKTGNMAAAQEIVDTFGQLDDSPYHYGKAALAFGNNRILSGYDWTRRASFVYSPAEHQIFLDSFVELGWVPSIEGPSVNGIVTSALGNSQVSFPQ